VLRGSAHMQTPTVADWLVGRLGMLALLFAFFEQHFSSCASVVSQSVPSLCSHTQDAEICSETTGHARGSALFGTTIHAFETRCSQRNNWRNAQSIGTAALNLPPPNKGNRTGRKQILTAGPKDRAQINVNKLSCDGKNSSERSKIHAG
jgi:hypothetical protein